MRLIEEIRLLEKKLSKKRLLEDNKKSINELTHAQIDRMRNKAETLINKMVVVGIQYQETPEDKGDIIGVLHFVSKDSIILDMDGNIKTNKDRRVYGFRDIVSIRELKINSKMEVD